MNKQQKSVRIFELMLKQHYDSNLQALETEMGNTENLIGRIYDWLNDIESQSYSVEELLPMYLKGH